MTGLDVVRDRELIVCCGAGGVGKTTTSAAIAIRQAASVSGRVLVLTIDPARRLATALGIADIGSEPTRISPARLRRAGIEPAGEMWAAMLDPKATWDEVIERHAPDIETAQAIKSNRFYRSISDAFAGSQEYMAMEALYEFHRTGEFDCIVVDTPPSRNALDFIEAPSRVSDFVGTRFVGWLAGGGTRIGFRAFDFAAMPMLRILGRVLGSEGLDELREFASLIRGLYEGIQKRGKQVYRLLRSQKTGFVVVTTLEPAAFAEAEFFAKKLRDYGMPLAGVVVNRVLPEWLSDPSANRAAMTLADDEGVDEWLRVSCGIDVSTDAIKQAGEEFLTYSRLATRESGQAKKLSRLGKVPLARIPLLDEGVSDLEGLQQIAASLL